MPELPNALRDWPSGSFQQTLKHEIEQLDQGELPLEKGTTLGGLVDDGNICVSVLNAADAGDAIHAKLGVFFTEIMICCGCGDDPMPNNAYCEMRVSIDKQTAQAEFVLIPD